MSKLLKRLNDNQNKVADTNGIMKLQAWDYGVAQDLTGKTIQATVANTSGFLFDIDLVSNGTEIDLDFKDSQLQKLTPDTYFLEIKVTDEDGDVSVFPTEGYATFTINKNLHATEGALVPQITFDTVLADVKTAMDEKVADYTSTIAKGDKGDKGDPGKDAEMPVIGGRNLLLGTANWSGGSTIWDPRFTSKEGTYRGMLIAASSSAWTSPAYMIGNTDVLQIGKTYTFSTYVRNTSDTDTKISYYYDRTILTPPGIGIPLLAHSDWTRVSATFNVIKDPATSSYGLRWESQNSVTNGQIQFAGYKLEEGNVATDWSPAPEDVQSDITKRAIDTSVVHNTGNEIVAGNKTFTGGINFNGNVSSRGAYKTATVKYQDATMTFYETPIGVQVTVSGNLTNFKTNQQGLASVTFGTIPSNITNPPIRTYIVSSTTSGIPDNSINVPVAINFSFDPDGTIGFIAAHGKENDASEFSGLWSSVRGSTYWIK